MADRWAVASGNWSNTATWNGGTLPGSGDDVFADGFAVTIDQNITVLSLRTSQRSGGTIGGSFATSGARTVTADTYAGSTSCLTLTSASNSVQNGNSHGSTTNGSIYGTVIWSTCVQNGTATGGSVSFAHGSNIQFNGVLNGDTFGGSGGSTVGVVISAGGVQNGDSTAGSATSSIGTLISNAGIQYGDSFAANSNSEGTRVDSGGLQVGNSTGGSHASSRGTEIYAGGIQIGNAVGGSVSGAAGTLVRNGGIFTGDATGGSASGAVGVQITLPGGMAFIDTATATSAFAVLCNLSSRYVVLIKTEVGSAKSLTAGAETTGVNVPFVNYNAGSGGVFPRIGGGGLVY